MLGLKLTNVGHMPQFPSKGQIMLKDKRDSAQLSAWQDSCSGPSHQLHPRLFSGGSVLLESCSLCSLPRCMQCTCYSGAWKHKQVVIIHFSPVLGTLREAVHPNTMQINVLFQWKCCKHCLLWGGIWTLSRSGWMVALLWNTRCKYWLQGLETSFTATRLRSRFREQKDKLFQNVLPKRKEDQCELERSCS